MSGEIQFNLQDFLSEMRGEMNDGFEKVHSTSAKIREDLVQHEKNDLSIAGSTDSRLKALETAHSNIKWALRTIAGAGLVGAIALLFDVLKNHWR